MVEIVVPDLGEDVEKAKISFWHYEEGDKIEKNSDIVELTTDKATFNVPAPETGIITELYFEEGDEVEVGEVIALIDDENEELELSEDEEEEDTNF
ncbi:MAG: lipoyl domain-containing protein [bacterium]|nr:lipoyl domain-containing protein [bacterium]